MFKFLVTVGGNTTDYTHTLLQSSVNITEQINIPAQMTFSLTPIGTNFVLPPPRAYVQLWSTTYNKSLFSGYITNSPTRRYLAKSSIANPALTGPNAWGSQLFEFDFTATSDEYLLNVKAIQFIPAFINRTQGGILTDLANLLCSGFFGASGVASGDIVPFYQYDPTKSWSELAKDFGDASRYRYKARDKQLTYQPYGDNLFGIVYNEATQKQSAFAPKDLNTTVLQVPVVNDVTIIGDIEAGNNCEDYFVGDGFTADYALLHQVFRGASALLLQETWQNDSLNLQTWYLQDEGDNFDFSAGALNIVTAGGIVGGLGESFLQLNNGIELAGGIDIESGEFTWNDVNEGIIGGVYTDENFIASNLICGFGISSSGGVSAPGASGGVAGVIMQPMVNGQAIGHPLTSKQNHNYVLQMIITAPQYTRYTRTYRTLDGESFGGGTTSVSGSVTFNIQDYDIAAATGFFYTPKVHTVIVNNLELPAFGAFALINNIQLNLTDNYTTIAQMPLGTLQAMVGPSGLVFPTGSVLPLLPPDSGGYIGGVSAWPSIASGSILPPPLPLIVTGQPDLVLGNGFELQAAQITQGQSADKLDFYAQTTPTAGSRIRLQTWASQAAVSRLQNPASISGEAAVVGDDGIRSAIVSNLNPLPRTSEDCDNAATAYLLDRTATYYNGTYACTSLFFSGAMNDTQFYPTVGRFFHINAPYRGITLDDTFLVTGLQITMLDMLTELVQYQITFGADMYLEKVLANFVDLVPANILTPTDTANPPDPRNFIEAGDTYYPDLDAVQIDMNSYTTTDFVVKVLGAAAPIEIRRLDRNWGKGITPDYVGTEHGNSFTLTRKQYEEEWFMRPVLGGKTSRRSKVIRIKIPTRPTSPTFVSNLSLGGTMQYAQAGDVRSIYGLELRTPPQKSLRSQLADAFAPNEIGTADQWSFFYDEINPKAPLSGPVIDDLFFPDGRPADPALYPTYTVDEYVNILLENNIISAFELYDTVVLYQQPVLTNPIAIDLIGGTPLTFLSGYPFEQIDIYAYFFNVLWEYSEPTVITVFPGAVGTPPFPWATSGSSQTASGCLSVRPTNFGLREKLTADINGNITPQIVVDGFGTINTFSEIAKEPSISLESVPGGGSISGGLALTVGVWGQDKEGHSTRTALSSIKIAPQHADNAIVVTIGMDDATDCCFCAITPNTARGWYGPSGNVVFNSSPIASLRAAMLAAATADFGPDPVINADFWNVYYNAFAANPLTDPVLFAKLFFPHGRPPNPADAPTYTVDAWLAVLETANLFVTGVQFTFTELGPFQFSGGISGAVGLTPVPDINSRKYIVQVRTDYQCGIWGDPVMDFASSGDGTCRVVFATGQDWDADEFVGRTFGILSRFDPTQPIPITDVLILENDLNSVLVSGDISQLITTGDIGFCHTKADIFSLTGIGDTKLRVSTLPGSTAPGMIPDSYVGLCVKITRGTGCLGGMKLIKSNTDVLIIPTTPFDIAPDETSEFSIISPIIAYEFDSPDLAFADDRSYQKLSVPIANAWGCYFVQVVTEDDLGDQSDQRYSPFREMFQPGFAGASGFGVPQAEFVFGIGLNGGPADIVADSTTNLVIVKTQGVVYGWDAVAEVPPAGGDTLFTILRTRKGETVDMFAGAPIRIPGGASGVVGKLVPPYGALDVKINDQLQGLVVAVAGDFPGQRATVNLYWKAGPSSGAHMIGQ